MIGGILEKMLEELMRKKFSPYSKAKSFQPGYQHIL